MPAPIVAVEFDLYDGSATRTLRLWNGNPGGRALTRSILGAPVRFDPRLYTPMQFGARIAAEQYGTPMRGDANTGAIDFAITEAIWLWLAYHWRGRTCRVYEGEAGATFDELSLVYTGRVADLTFETGRPRASAKTTDASLDLDGPLVTDLYDDTAPLALRGRPKPYLRGTVYSAAPVLEDEATQTYRLSWGANLAEIMEVRVGGVPWQFVVGTPGAGQWSSDLPTGIFNLGSPALGAEVRCDARAVGWESLTSAALIADVVTAVGGTIDSASLAAFAAAAPGLIGFYAIDPINRLDVLDMIVNGAGAWWYFGADAAIRAGIIAAPAATADVALAELDIASLGLVSLIPPAWRIRTEWKRNWHPLTNTLPGVTDADAKTMAAGGIVAAAFEDETIKTAEPRALDVPLIRALFVNEADALEVRDRLVAAWTVARRLYNVTSWAAVLELYDTASVQYQMVSGNFRVHSAQRSVGGAGPASLQIWG